MILSIKSRVFGAYYPSYQNVTFDITDTFISENPYYLIAVSDEEVNGLYYAYVCRSNSPITTDSSKNTAYSFKFFNLQGTGITGSWGPLSVYLQILLITIFLLFRILTYRLKVQALLL